MRTLAKMWGNSLAIRIPKALAADTGLTADQEVDITIEEGRLIITPMRSEHEYELAALLEGITQDNLHGEVDFGVPVGRETL